MLLGSQRLESIGASQWQYQGRYEAATAMRQCMQQHIATRPGVNRVAAQCRSVRLSKVQRLPAMTHGSPVDLQRACEPHRSVDDGTFNSRSR